MGEHALILITCGEPTEAKAIARRLVDERLAAGVQLVPIESIYRWGGDVVEDREWLLIVKTREDRFERVKGVVGEMHSYDVPPVLMLEIGAASRRYLDWIDQTVQ